MRKCRYKSCREELPPKAVSGRWQSVGFCGIDCMAAHGLAMAKRQADCLRARQKQDARKSAREAKARIKTRAEWLREAQAAVNAWIRWRDRADGCISCDRPASWRGQWHASHWLSVGASSATRFNLRNIHKACSICNAHLSGNLRGYTVGLQKKIGLEEIERLESQRHTVKYDVEYLKRLRDVYRRRLRIAEKRES